MKELQVKFQTTVEKVANQALAILINKDASLDLSGIKDQTIVKTIEKAYRSALNSSHFDVKTSAPMSLHAVLEDTTLIFVATGKKTTSIASLVELGGALAKAAASQKYDKLTVICPAELLTSISEDGTDNESKLASLAMGIALGNYRFANYLTGSNPRNPKLTDLQELFLVSACDNARAQTTYQDKMLPVVHGVLTARNLGNEPTNQMTTKKMVEACLALQAPRLTVRVINEKELRELKMNALLAVGQGSDQESYAVIMSWQGREGKDVDLAALGKGVVFDTGGISIKPSHKMEDMKFDMCGAGAVIGLMRALSERKAPVNVVGVVGLVENMPSAKAQRPGDIVRSMSGITIEVTNTDAEGRMVLADLITYTQRHYKPSMMVDLATLTGSIIVALGGNYAGLFSNNEKLAGNLEKAGLKVEEKLWNMPMHESYDAKMDSKVADVLNAEAGREAGSVTAAKFLERFVDKGLPWAHIDIAGTAWIDKPSNLNNVGATGFGVRLLNSLVIDSFEKRS